MSSKIKFKNYLKSHINVIEQFDDFENIEIAINAIVKCLKKKLPLLVFGNGGSAADALHFSAELVGKYLHDREGFNVISLNANQSVITAWANDYEFDSIFKRQIAAHGKKNAVAIGFTTSGKSSNIIKAFEQCKEMDIFSIGLTGDNNNLQKYTNLTIRAPSKMTPQIQECHILIYHYMCQEIEERML